MDYVWLTSGPKDGRFGMLVDINSENNSIFLVYKTASAKPSKFVLMIPMSIAKRWISKSGEAKKTKTMATTLKAARRRRYKQTKPPP